MLLSICIPTLNRAEFIGETLDSIIPQLRSDMEVVIVDGGSGDDTASVVALRAARCPRVHYHLAPLQPAESPRPSNAGFDRDCDYSIQLANGRYCWILPDDDVVAPSGISRMVPYLQKGAALVVVNAEVRSNDLKRVLQPRRMRIEKDATFAAADADQLLTVAGAYLSYVGGVVVRRDWWLSRDRERHYGSGFVHMGALFQRPGDLVAVVISEPLIWLRYGNAQWTGRAFEIWMFQWPQLIWSFALPDAAKAAVTPREPWRSPLKLAFFRARGWYGWPEYRCLAALPQVTRLPLLSALLVVLIPAGILNLAALMAAFLISGFRSTWWLDLWQSPCNLLVRIPATFRRQPRANG